MTYEEAVNVIAGLTWLHLGGEPIGTAESESILDAIGFRKMCERHDADLAAMERLEGARNDWVDRAQALADERDAARVLADQLALALREFGIHGPERSSAHAAYEARDWANPAIGFREMQERIKELERLLSTNRIPATKFLHQRDAARALAGQLAGAIAVGDPVLLERGLAAYEARDWANPS